MGLVAFGAVALTAAAPALAQSAFQAVQGGYSQSGTAQASRLTIQVEAGVADQSVPLLPDPGPGGALAFSITNTSAVPLQVTALAMAAGGKVTSDQSACAAYASFTAPDLSARPWPPIPPHETLKVNGSDVNQLGLGLIHLAADTPSSCQGAHFQIPLTVTAQAA